MSTFVLSDCKLFLQEFYFNNLWNAGTLTINQELKECTQFNDGSRTYCADTLKSHTLSIKGYHNDNTTILIPDDYIHGEVGVNNVLCTVAPYTGADGEPAYFFKCAINAYTPLDGAWGDVAGYSMEAGGTGNIVRGTVMKYTTTDITGAGNGTAYNLGPCKPGQKVYAILHVYEFDGGTLDLAIQSDTTSGMSSAVEQIGFTNAAGVTSEMLDAKTCYLFYDAQTVNFAADETLTGGTSGATATILADTDWGTEGCLTLGDISGTFQDNETITDSQGTPGSATANGTIGETYLAYDNESGGPFTVGNTITGVTSGATGTLVALQDDGTTGKMLIADATDTYDNNEQIGDGSATADVDGDSSSETYWRAQWTYSGTACKFIVVVGIR
jgi:hypothetical protein